MPIAMHYPPIKMPGREMRVVPVAITGFEDWSEAEATLNAVEAQGFLFHDGLIRELHLDGLARTMLYAEMLASREPADGALLVRQWMAEAAGCPKWHEAAQAEIALLETQGFRIVKRWRKSVGHGHRTFPALQVVMRGRS